MATGAELEPVVLLTAGESTRTAMAPVVLCFLSGTWAGVCLSITVCSIGSYMLMLGFTLLCVMYFEVEGGEKN